MAERKLEFERGIEVSQYTMPSPTGKGSERWKSFYAWSELTVSSIALAGTFGLAALTAGQILFPEAVKPVLEGLEERWLSLVVGYAGLMAFSAGVNYIDTILDPVNKV